MNEMFSMSVSSNQRLRLWPAKPIKKMAKCSVLDPTNAKTTDEQTIISVVGGCPWVLWLSVVDFSVKLLLYSGTHTPVNKFNTFAVNLPSKQRHQAKVFTIQGRVQSKVGYFSLQLTNIKRRLDHIAGGVPCVKKVDLEVGLVLGGTGWRLKWACSLCVREVVGVVASPLQPDADRAERYARPSVSTTAHFVLKPIHNSLHSWARLQDSWGGFCAGRSWPWISQRSKTYLWTHLWPTLSSEPESWTI